MPFSLDYCRWRANYKLVQILEVSWLFLCPGGRFLHPSHVTSEVLMFFRWLTSLDTFGIKFRHILVPFWNEEQNYRSIHLFVKLGWKSALLPLTSLILNMLLVSVWFPDIEKRLNITVEMLLFFWKPQWWYNQMLKELLTQKFIL